MDPGLKMWVEDVEGLQHVGFHFNINEQLNGVDYGQENVEIEKVHFLFHFYDKDRVSQLERTQIFTLSFNQRDGEFK
jgi:hypothetical protein